MDICLKMKQLQCTNNEISWNQQIVVTALGNMYKDDT